MPAVQNIFPIRQDAGIPGGAAMSRYQSDSAVVQGAPIPFGAAVQRGTDPRGISTLASGGVFMGIARQKRGGLADRHEVGSVASYFTAGTGVFVLADAAVAVDTVVRYNTATGRYTNAAASATVIECTGWTFDTVATAAGQLVIIKRV